MKQIKTKTLYRLSKIRFYPETEPIRTQHYDTLEQIQETMGLSRLPRLYTPIKDDKGDEWVVSETHTIQETSNMLLIDQKEVPRMPIKHPESPVTAFESNSGQTTHNEVATPQNEHKRICAITPLIVVWILVVALGAIVTYTLIANNITPQ